MLKRVEWLPIKLLLHLLLLDVRLLGVEDWLLQHF